MGWNQKEAALACGLSQASWRGWELKGHEPRGFQAISEQIAGRTGVDQYWIMTGKVQGEHPSGPGGNVVAFPGGANPRALDYMAGGSGDVGNVISLWPAPVEDHEWATAA